MKRVQLIAIISVLMLLSSLVSACSQQTDGMVMEEATVPVITTKVTPHTIKSEVGFAGQIRALESVSVVGKMAGKVESVKFDIGDRVSMGDVLYMLDKQDIENQITTLTANLNTANVGIASAQTGLQQASSGGQVQSNISQLQAAIENTTQNIASTEQSMQAAQNAMSAAEKTMDSAQKTMDSVQKSMLNAQKAISAAELSIQAAQLAIDNSVMQLDDATKSYNDTKTLFDAGIATQSQMDSVELAYNKAVAAKQQAEIQYEQAKLQREQAEVQYEQAEIQYEQAEIQYEQAGVQYEQAGVQYNQTEIQYNQAVIARNQATENYNIMTQQTINDNKQIAANSVNSAVAQRDALAVQLDIARSTLDDLSVTSPISGIVTSRNITAGEMASMAVPSFVIENIDTVKVDVKVSEMIINKLALDQEVNVNVKTLDDSVIVGKIKSIVPSADATNMYPVKIEIDNTDGLLKPGMFAEVSFVKEMSVDTIVVSRDTVMQDEKGSFVYINENGFAKRVAVQTGIDNGQEIEILDGVSLDTEVITTGQTNVIEGIKINVVS